MGSDWDIFLGSSHPAFMHLRSFHCRPVLLPSIDCGSLEEERSSRSLAHLAGAHRSGSFT